MSNAQISDVSSDVRSAFNFSVDKFPLYGPDNMKTDQYGLFRSDTGYIDGLKSISSRYVPHTTDDVCALVEAASTALDDTFICKTHWNRGHYVILEPSRDRRKAIYGTKDNIFLRIMIRGGFDGKGFKADVARYRDACANLDIPRLVEGNCVSIPHTSGLRSRMDELVTRFESLSDGWDAMMQQAEEMQANTVNLSSFLRQVYEDQMPTVQQILLAESGTPVKKVTIFEKMIAKVKARIVNERKKTLRPPADVESQFCEVSGWEAYNAVQGYAQHDSRAKKGFDSSFARILRASNDKAVAKAEQLALAI